MAQLSLAMRMAGPYGGLAKRNPPLSLRLAGGGLRFANPPYHPKETCHARSDTRRNPALQAASGAA